MKIKYITNVRIPSMRAQGYAIMKMCSEFAKLGHRVELFVPSRKNNENIEDPFIYYKLDKNFKINKIPSLDLLGRTMKFGKLFYWIDILTFILASKIKIKLDPDDVVYTRDYITTLFLPKRNFDILEIHDIPRSKFLFKLALNKADGFVVISNGIKEEILKLGVQEEKIIVSPSGVNIDELDIDIKSKDAKKRLELPTDLKIVMYIGLLDEWKGYQTLLDASSYLIDNARLVIIGGYKAQIDRLKKKYPNVIFLGSRPYSELALNQKAGDVLVVPNSGKYAISKYYTSPIKLFTHMVSKIPIVVSDLPSMREILSDEDCYFVKPDDPQDLANSINKVLLDSDLAKKVAEKAYSKVEKYSWDKRAKNILDKIQIWI